MLAKYSRSVVGTFVLCTQFKSRVKKCPQSLARQGVLSNMLIIKDFIKCLKSVLLKKVFNNLLVMFLLHN